MSDVAWRRTNIGYRADVDGYALCVTYGAWALHRGEPQGYTTQITYGEIPANYEANKAAVIAALAAEAPGLAARRSAANHRAALVRVVVAQQWAVAMAMINGSGVWIALGGDEKRWSGFGDDDVCAFNVAALPCADDVVSESLGEVRS